jgi:hypothetical protein
MDYNECQNLSIRKKLNFNVCQKSQKLHAALLIVFIILFSFSAFSENENLIFPPKNLPVEVSVDLYINKIYNINTVDETYQIDGYLEYSWVDERLKLNGADSISGPRLYENDRVKELIHTKIWFPAFELMNVQGDNETPNISLEIYPDGKVIYYERFFGTFSTYMNFRDFPFDSQNFKIQIEAFSYDSHHLIFTNPKLYFEITNNSFIEKWEIVDTTAVIVEQPYAEGTSDNSFYSRVEFEIYAKRMTGYYLWQVLFPLFIIIMASFVIFWIKDFGTQIGIGFTLMLTVVAFNFYSTSILPELPYQTFIETIIIVGYVFIFLGIISVIINYRIFGDKIENLGNNKLMRVLRYLFPLTFFAALIYMFFLFKID